MSHAGFLRDHTGDDAEDGVIALVRALAAAGEQAAELPLRDGVAHVHEAIERIPESARLILEPADLPILHFVAEVALAPRWMERARVEYLRDAGLDDRTIHDVVHVVCCFSYMNRLADGLGVGVFTEDRQRWAARLLGDEALERHLEWANPVSSASHPGGSMPDLSDDELDELRETFNHFDLDHNGHMDIKELSKLLTTLGGDDAADGLDAAIAALDSDGNGTIEFDEFVEWWTGR